MQSERLNFESDLDKRCNKKPSKIFIAFMFRSRKFCLEHLLLGLEVGRKESWVKLSILVEVFITLIEKSVQLNFLEKMRRLWRKKLLKTVIRRDTMRLGRV